jgi:hypothetical protein
MSTATAPKQSDELTRLEILRAYKKHFGRDAGVNVSPFTEDRIIRYDSDVQAADVPDIHGRVRKLIHETVVAVRHGQPSQVVILAGGPGMGKSHLINHFRCPAVAEELGYVLVGNSNHWKVVDFEECLLDWILEALVQPSPNGPHLLLEKIEDLGFQALGQLLSQPGQLRRYKAKGASGFFRRLWARISGREYGRFQYMIERRHVGVFRMLNFPKFAGYVCDRFLPRSGNPYHRYVLRVLLQYLFEPDRELVLHWLRRKPVHDAFLKKLGSEDAIDRKFKVIDVIKILISLFTTDVARNLSSRGAKNSADKVFFFAFDQTEARQELFDREEDWLKFFAQLSELYNALPNVFILFTMTLGLRKQLYHRMEGQFQDRIRGDQRFWLQEVADDEILALYRQRIDCWLGPDLTQVRASLAELAQPYLPFDQETALEIARGPNRSVRDILNEFDERFRRYLDGEVVEDDPRHDFLVSRNELRRAEAEARPFDYTASHLAAVKEFFEKAGALVANRYGLNFAWAEDRTTEDSRPALHMQFEELDNPGRWIRVFLVRLPFQYNPWLKGSVGLLRHLQTDRNYLWLVRCERIDEAVTRDRPGQIFARKLEPSVQTDLLALLRLLEKKDRYDPKQRAVVNDVLAEVVKLTYLGEMMQQVHETMEKQPGEKATSRSAKEPLEKTPG